MKKGIQIYCDGACKGNPGPSGSGIVVFHDEKLVSKYYGGYKDKGTNNTAELWAFSAALALAKKAKDSNLSPIYIFSDSKYAINAITLWAYNWKKKDWKDVKNREVIEKSHTLYDDIKESVKIVHVKGHSGVHGNELADKMANLAVSSKERGYKKK